MNEIWIFQSVLFTVKIKGKGLKFNQAAEILYNIYTPVVFYTPENYISVAKYYG